MKDDKNKLLEKMEARFTKLENEIDDYNDKIESKLKEGTEEYKDEINNLVQNKVKLQKKLNGLRDTGTQKWSTLTNSFEDNLQQLKLTFSNFKKKFEV